MIVNDARNKVEVTVNSELIILYWNVGKIIKTQILGEDKAEYGKRIIQKLSQEWIAEYGRGYSPQKQLIMQRYLWNNVNHRLKMNHNYSNHKT